MKRYLFYKFFVILFLLVSSLSAELRPIGNDDRYQCSLDSANDRYGYFSRSSLLKFKQGQYQSVSFQGQYLRIKKNIRFLRSKIIQFKALNQTIRLQRNRSSLRDLRLIFKDIKSCQAQRDNYYIDLGFGSNVDACDVASGEQNFVARIINGKSCARYNSPVVRLYLEDRHRNTYLCSGTLINPRVIITAAHCLQGIQRVVIETARQTVPATRFKANPLYNGLATNDLGVVISSQDLQSNYIPLISKLQALSLGENVIIAGYGVDQIGGDDSSSSLIAGKNTISKVTSRALSIEFNENSQSNTCFGDSGGPLFVYRNSRWVLAGVTANGLREDCGYGDKSNFTNLLRNSNRNFLRSEIPNLVD